MSDAPQLDWQTVLTEHDRWLRTIVRARIFEPEGVEEVMQNVALAAVRQAAPLKDASKAPPWLYRLAVRQALLYRRKLGRQRKLMNGFKEVASETEELNNPLEWLLATERRSLVRQALARLPERDSQILLLKYTENWSYHDIARHLGVSHAAVESRLFRGRRRLRQELVALQLVEIT